MIETLRGETALLDQEELVIFDLHDLKITGITFEDGNLSKPRYHSLIDQSHAPVGVQFEPCLQIRHDPGFETLTIRFEIDPESGVNFIQNPEKPGEVMVTALADPQSFDVPGLLSANLIDPKSCDLVWQQSAAGSSLLNTLRLHCSFEDGGSRPLTPLEIVEGGLYLAILNRKEGSFHETHSNPPGEAVPGTVKMLGFDTHGRPVYDLFLPHDNLPEALALEPAFRCREGQIVSFNLALDLPPEVDLEFVRDKAPNHDQVGVTGYLPNGHPFQLYQTTVGDFGGQINRNCLITWAQETGRQYCAISNPGEAKRNYCILGQTSAFGLRATLAGVHHSMVAPEERAELDPTVIQPPSCTASGICITP